MLFWNDISGAKILKNHSLANKKVNRTLLGTGVAVILILLLLIGIRMKSVQTLLVNKYLDRIEKKYDGKLSVGEVLVRWPHRLELINILILDPIDDTLFYASSLRGAVTKLDLDRNRIQLKRVIVEDPTLNLRELPSGKMNFEQLVSSLSGKDTSKTPKPLTLSCNQFIIRKGAFTYKKYGAVIKPGKINPDHLRVTGIESQINQFVLDSAATHADVDMLSCQEMSGFRIDKLSGGITWDSTGISANLVEILTGNSRIESPSAHVSNLQPVPGDSSGLSMEIVLGMDTYISPVDINFMSTPSLDLADPLEISGLFSGTLKNAELSDTRIKLANLFFFEGDLTYEFPGTLQQAYFDLRTRSLSLNLTGLTDDVLSGQIPGFELEVPAAVRDLGRINYSGLFTGTFENFITTGVWSLPYGDFTTNLTVNKNRPVKGFNFHGSVSTGDLNPDEWTDQPSGISAADLTFDVDGVWDGAKEVHAMINGDIRRITLNSYTYEGFTIRGEATGSSFDGSVLIRDPNLNMDLTGRVDFGKDIPSLSFDMLLAKADLDALNLVRNDTASALTLAMHGDLSGKSMDEIQGSIRVQNSSYTNSRGTLPIDELTLTAREESKQRQILLSSDYVDARLVGTIHIEDMPSQVQSLVARFIPALTNIKAIDANHLNDFAFNVQLKNPAPVLRILLPGFQCKDDSRLSGSYSADQQIVYIEGYSPQFTVKGTQYTGFDLRLESRGDSLVLAGDLDKMQIDRNNQFERIRLDALLSENDLMAGLNWKNSKAPVNRGNISISGQFGQTPEKKLTGSLKVPGAEITYNDSLWTIEPFVVSFDPDRLDFNHFKLRHKSESLGVTGAISVFPSDTLYLTFDRVNLNHVNQLTRSDDMTLTGQLSGNARFYDMRGKGMFLADLEIDSLGFNGQMLGKTTITSRSGGSGEPVDMSILTHRGSIKTLRVTGSYNPVTDSLDFDINLDKLRMDIVNPFVAPDLRDVKGIVTGGIKVSGLRHKPQLNGELMVQKGSFIVDYINTRFFFTHPVIVTPNAFIFNGMDMTDDEGNHATISSGAVRHNDFKNLRLDIALDYKDFVLLNADELKNDGYWGRAYATGVGTIKGPLRNLMIDVSATTSQKTKFFVPVNTAGEAREMDFITYVERKPEESEPDLLDFTGTEKPRGYEVNLHGATVNIDLAVTPDAEVQLIFDSKVGDVLRARGSGDIRIYVNPASRWTITGDYTIEEGDYQFTLQNMPVKKLEIEPGGTIKWTRDVASAQLDIDAVYRTKASLYDLLQDESNSDLAQRIPVECHLMMSGYLENPSFDFNIVVPPTSDDIARSQLANLTEEEMNKQIISLLILNRFMPLQGSGSGTTRGYATAGLATTTEMLSNQLNYWLSQISNDFDIGFNYRPGDELTSDEVEVALSKQFFNNRMTLNVNGNYDVRQTNANANQLVGDVEVEYKINPSGKLRLKAFTRANDHLLYEYAPYTQGVGLFYREEFNSFSELFRKYRNKLPGNKR